MYTISKDFSFSASHQLVHLPEHHPCSRLHGHNYLVRVTLGSSVLDEKGFIHDYLELAPFERYIADQLDHQHLNDVLGFPTTAENIAQHLYNIVWNMFHDCIVEVAVSETPRTWATYKD